MELLVDHRAVDWARWVATHVSVLVSGLAAVGGHIWAVGVTGKRPPHGGDGSGRVVVLQQAGNGWLPVAAPAGAVDSTLPQLAAGSSATAWILCYRSDGGKAGQGTLFYWNGRLWRPISIPAKAGRQALYISGLELDPDGRTGVWAGPNAQWTGRRWVGVTGVRPGNLGPVDLNEAAGMPGAAGSWAVGASGGFITTTPSGPAVIAVNGPMP